MKSIQNMVTMLFFSMGLIFMLPSCWSAEIKNGPEQQVNAVEKKRGTMGNLVIINLLEKQYYDDCHIAGSVNVELQDLEKFVAPLDKKIEIIVYCSDYWCTASGLAWKKLTSMGFENVWAYEGGTAEWYQLNLPVEGLCKEKYLTKKVAKPVHDAQEVRVISAQELMQKISEHQ